jgi:hypothetical protein
MSLNLKENRTDLRKIITPIALCAGSFGEALRPPPEMRVRRGFGGSPPSRVFLQTTIFRLSQCHSS